MRFAKPIVVFSVLLVAVAFLPASAFAQDGAAVAISSAKQQLLVSFDSAKQAESAGANISSLTTVLNQAGDLLSRAELAYSQGDVGGALSLATLCSQRLSSFAAEAEALRVAAAERASFDFWVLFVGSILGTFVVIVAGIVMWLVVKRRYVPVEVETEVHVDESTGD